MSQERDLARVNKQGEERGGGTHGQDLNKKVSSGGSEESLGRLPEMEDLNAWPPFPCPSHSPGSSHPTGWRSKH